MSGDRDEDPKAPTWCIEGVEPEIIEAARLAARQSGQTLSEWVSRAVGHAALNQLSGPDAAAAAADGDLADFTEMLDEEMRRYLEDHAEDRHAADEPMTAVVELTDRSPEGDGLSPELRAEFDSMRLLIHEYMGAMLPALETVDEASSSLRELAALTQDMRHSAEEARRAAELIVPLERALGRLSEFTGPGITEDRHERRAAGFGKLFRN